MYSSRRCHFFFQAEDGIRDLVRSRGLGDVYKRQSGGGAELEETAAADALLPQQFCNGRSVERHDALLSLIHI